MHLYGVLEVIGIAMGKDLSCPASRAFIFQCAEEVIGPVG
jgi:hypothetical protein